MPCILAGGLAACGGSDSEGDNAAPVANIMAEPASGVATLMIDVDASQSSDDSGIVGYLWDFGDGSSSELPSTTHRYTQVGSYTLTLTVTDANGLFDTASTTIRVLDSIDNTQVIVPQGVQFYDDFEYTVARTEAPNGTSNVDNPFVNQGGWSLAKAINISSSYNGYLYTVGQIPGYDGFFPGRNSTSVLAMEARAATFADPNDPFPQTDFYLQYGDGTSEAVGGNIWFQFWIYPNSFGDQLSTFDRNNKFIYPCRAAAYPCTDLNWLGRIGQVSGEPHWAPEDPQKAYFSMVAYGSVYDLAAPENASKLGQQNVDEYPMLNRWTLVKMHMDTSTASGSYEVWLKPMGGNWVKVSEWIDGVTPNFSWNIPAGQIGGHRMFRMPTTIGNADSWLYMDDFAIATSEAELPLYPY